MYLIVGLGNPGTKYHNTRHNTGFETLDILIDRFGAGLPRTKWKAFIGQGVIGGEKVLFAKPLTYMNLSGEAVQPIAAYYGIDPSTELVVISDDTDLPVGKIRIRKGGSAGGHNGLKSIIRLLGTQDFIRVRVGIGNRPAEYEMADYVLGHFSPEDRQEMEKAREVAAEACAAIVTDGIDRAMNLYNKKEKKPKPPKKSAAPPADGTAEGPSAPKEGAPKEGIQEESAPVESTDV